MRLRSVTIKNVRSFKQETTVNFDEHFNILIGPNGSGKSNLLDIVNIALREYILYTYVVNPFQTETGILEDISRDRNAFGSIKTFLGKFSGDDSEMYIKFSFVVSI